MAIDTVYRCRIDFDFHSGDVNKDQDSIKKVSDFIFSTARQFNLDECETSEGGPAHGPYCVLEHDGIEALEKSESAIMAYIRRFKHHKIEGMHDTNDRTPAV
ncbi:hypothetical protein [Serratia proteamaculans]|uniref:hypothetical protein n=1 Tax=Serratia proteamaculans TaxID=28151 RepID=UPI003D05183D